VLSVSFGSDPGYFSRHVEEHQDPERGNYYLSAAEHGEPPGAWYGPGAEAIGFTGEVDKEAMITLYKDLVHPVTGEALGARPYRFKDTPERVAAAVAAEGQDITPERRAEIELAVRKDHREARNYADATFSAAKSWSVLHAGLQSQGRHDDAEAVWAAWMDGVEAGVAYLRQNAGYSRAGRHGAKVAGRTSGRWVEAPDWVMSTWRHHTSREGDPQLHVHVAILNRVRCEDGKWRSLDGKAIVAAKPAAGAIAERTAEESLARRLGVSFATRPDGKAREIVGVEEAVRDRFSARRRAITEGVATLAGAYEAKYGHAPNAYVLTLISEHVTLDTRKAKPDHPPTRDQLLDRWEAQTRTVVQGGLSRVVDQVGIDPQHTPSPEAFDPGLVIDQAVWELQSSRATWTRHDLIAALNRQLPDALGGLSGAHTEALLGELADAALSPGGEVIRLAAPELVPAPDELRRADGRSIYEPPDADRYATRGHLRTEDGVVAAARSLDGPKVDSEVAQRLLGTSPLSESQAAAVAQLLTSGRVVEPMIGYAGVGKTFTMAELARLWTEATGTPALGLTTAERARQVLAEEGFKTSANIARFLGAQRRIEAGKAQPGDEQYRLRPGQLVVIDEASMVTTADMAAIVEISRRSGAKVVPTGDDQQLSAVGSGGLFRLLTQEVEGVALVEVRRFSHAWEREASQRFRSGDVEVLAEYDRRGRIKDGSRAEMITAATRAAVAEHLRGERSLLIAGTNEAAAELSSEIRAELVRLGRVRDDGVALHDGNRAGVGDVIIARQNDYTITSAEGVPVVNRSVYVVTEQRSDGSLVGRLISGRQGAEETHDLPASYVGRHVELGYAATAHSAQGVTVRAGAVLVDENLSREGLYVGASRGAERNTMYVVTHDHGDHRSPGERPDRLGVLAGVMEREGAEQSATEVMGEEIAGAESLARLEPIWADVVGDQTRQETEARILAALDAENRERLAQDKALPNVARLVRQAEVAGFDRDQLIETVTRRELASAESPATVLAWRIEHHIGDAPPARTTWVDRSPEGHDARSAYARQLAEAMERRVSDLGAQAAADPPAWARPLGPVPPEADQALIWAERAGAIAAYREAHGYQSPHDPIGPAPLPGAVEARASWQRAYDALGRPEAQRDLAGAPDAELRAIVDRYRREEAWAPPHVDAQMRERSLSLDNWRSAVEIEQAQAQSDAGNEPVAAEVKERLHHQRAAMYELQADVAALEEIAEARAAWYEETREARDRAAAARRELRARQPELKAEGEDHEPKPLDSKERQPEPREQQREQQEADRQDHEPEVEAKATEPPTPSVEQVKVPDVPLGHDEVDHEVSGHVEQSRREAEHQEPVAQAPEPERADGQERQAEAKPEREDPERLAERQAPEPERADGQERHAGGKRKREEPVTQPPEPSQVEADLAKARQAMAEIDARRAARRAEHQQDHERSDYEHLRTERDAVERSGYGLEPGGLGIGGP
jgi:conjugative relaxase-like TrwC/TraI family protein